MSTVARVEELRLERAQVFEEMKTVNEAALTESRDLTAEEKERYDKLEQRMETLTEQVDRNEKLAGIEGSGITRRAAAPPAEERDIDDKKKSPETLKEFNEQRAGRKPQDESDYRKAFYRYMTVKDLRDLTPDEQRVLSKASAGAGANLVPTNFATELIAALRDFGVMRQISRVISTTGGEALQVPSVSTHGTAAWTAENAAYTASDEAFGLATLNAYKAATLMIVSEELLQDAAFDLEAYIRQEFGQRIGVLENTGYVAGDGSAKPTGAAVQASAGVTAASATAITADELMDLFHSLLPPYRRNASWLMKDSTIKLIRKLKTGVSGDNTYIWQPGLQAGQPDVILGRPVYADPDMAAATTGLVSVLFGDFSFYWIRDVDGISLQRLNELYAANGQVGFRAWHRTDGKLLNTAAVKKLTQL